MVTATPKKSKSKPQETAATPPVKPATQHFLQERCMEVDIEISWLRTSKKVDDGDAATMTSTVNASRTAVSVSKRLYDSKVPAVKELNAARSRLKAYINSITIPVAAIPPEHADDPADFLLKAPGSRLILIRDMDEFDTRIGQLVAELMAAARQVDLRLTEIKIRERDRLGSLYRESDYPDMPSKSISVRGPFYREVGFRADFSKLAPQACERAIRQMERRLQSTVELAASEFCEELATATSQIAAQLSNRTRLNPPRSHALHAPLDKAELLTVLRHADDEEVPEGMVQIYARVASGKGKKTDARWFGPMTESEFLALNPRETDEKCKVFDSTILSLREKLESFRRLGETFGPHSQPIAEQVSAIERLLSDRNNVPRPADQLAKEMRTSSGFRQQLSTALSAVSASVIEVSALTAAPVRRRQIARKRQASDE